MWGMEVLVAAEIRSWGRATPETTLFPPEELARTSEKRLIIGSGACRCQIRSQTPEGGQLAEGGLMALWRAVSPQVSGEGAVGGTTHDIFPSKLFVSPIASDRDGVLEGQGGMENRSAAVVDRSAAETTLLPPSVRSSEKGVRSPKPAMDTAHRRGFPARKTTLASPARTRTCQACKAINDATARVCQAAPYSTPLLKLTSVSLARPLAEHRRYLASHGLCAFPWHTNISERSNTCTTCRSVGNAHRPCGRPFRSPLPRPFHRRSGRFRAGQRRHRAKAASWHSSPKGSSRRPARSSLVRRLSGSALLSGSVAFELYV